MRFFNRFICFVPAILSAVFLAGCAKSIEPEKPKPGPSEPQEMVQKKIPAPRLSVSTINLDRDSGTATLEVVADTTWKTVFGYDDWNPISISPDSGHKGTTTVTITVTDKKVELDNFMISFYNYLPAHGEESHLCINREGADRQVLEAISQWLEPGSEILQMEMFQGRICTLRLEKVNGKAPQILSELDSLKILDILEWKGHEGDFSIFKEFPVLEWLNLSLFDVNEIPKEFLSLTRLKRFYLFSTNLSFSGSIPEEFRYFPDLEILNISPGLSGPVPEWVLSSKFWPDSRSYMMQANEFDPLVPSFTFNDYFTGKEYDLADEISSHKYTMIVTYDHMRDSFDSYATGALAPYIEQMYQAYKDDGLQVIGVPHMVTGSSTGPFDIASYPTAVYLEPDGLRTDGTGLLKGFGSEYFNYVPDMTIIDSDGKICISSNQTTSHSDVADFLKEKFGHGYLYESKDYSRDGELRLVQKASKGRGIDLVFIGNCFSDRKIADGTFDKLMNSAVNAFFFEDPMYSMRDLFNIYIITTVSPNECCGPGTKSAIDLSFPDNYYSAEASIALNFQQVYDYSSSVASSDGRFVVVNYLPVRKGSCLMSYKDDVRYSEGGFTAMIAARDGLEMVQLVTHEACGHGVGKLADEYSYWPETPSWLTFDEATLKKYQMRGYVTNFSNTSNPEEVTWSRFLKDSRYEGEQLGVYEVGADSGYRSCRYDIMGMGAQMDAHSPFSAPNRYTLWRAISYMAYGDEFEDNYEDFVEMDADTRKFRSDWLNGKNADWYHPELGDPYSWFEPISNNVPLD